MVQEYLLSLSENNGNENDLEPEFFSNLEKLFFNLGHFFMDQKFHSKKTSVYYFEFRNKLTS